MNLFIPALGTKLELVQDWSFNLFRERRNSDFAIRLGVAKENGSKYCTVWNDGKDCWDSGNYSVKVTLPKGTVLGVNRIYIRQGATNYNSVTFTLKKGNCPDKKIHGRFWAKLNDVNNIKFDYADEESRKLNVIDEIKQAILKASEGIEN